MKFRGLSSTLYAQAILISALLSHHLAGGELVSGKKLLIGYFLILIPLIKVNPIALEGPHLALTIVGVQSLSHFYFGLNSQSDIRMATSHIIGGLLCYGFITKSSALFRAASRFISHIFTLSQLATFAPKLIKLRKYSTFQSQFTFFALVRSHRMRAPPSLGVSHA